MQFSDFLENIQKALYSAILISKLLINWMNKGSIISLTIQLITVKGQDFKFPLEFLKTSSTSDLISQKITCDNAHRYF